jgi:hypothetical protein
LQLRSSEWIEDLKEVLFTVSKAEQYLVEARNGLAINGEALFA